MFFTAGLAAPAVVGVAGLVGLGGVVSTLGGATMVRLCTIVRC
eukprot:SAG11_NODE_1055_length_6017_cov_1.548496_5_plen_43_part_00